MHRFLFDLMKKFDLCFIFPDDDCHYLIPELLDKQEPEATAEFDPEQCLNFQYHYPVLPEGLLPRFIVRTHTLSENLPRWRTGVILTFEGNRALVKADVQDKKVFISVSGTASGRRRLLAVIRSEFERIHRDIRNLQPQEMIPVPGHPHSVVSYKKLLVMEQERRCQLSRGDRQRRDQLVGSGTAQRRRPRRHAQKGEGDGRADTGGAVVLQLCTQGRKPA
jgi:internalin A